MSPAPYGRLPGRNLRRNVPADSHRASVGVAATYPQFITGGALFILDASDRRSYPGEGTTWFDLSGNNRNFTLVNGPAYSGADGEYINFDGSNDYASLPYDAELNATTWSVLVWVRLNANPDGNDAILIRNYPPTIQYYLDCRGNFQFGSYSDSTPNNDINVQSTTSCNSSNGVWRYIVGTWDGSDLALFVNGTREAKAAKTWGNHTSTAGMTLGALPISGSYQRHTNMRLGMVALYNRALTDAEVFTNYYATRGRFGL